MDLVPFGVLEGVGHDAGARPEPGPSALELDGPDGDARLEVSGRVDRSHGPSVDTPVLSLQLAQDLHGADLGRTADGARGEGAPERVEGGLVGPEVALDFGREVHDVGKSLHGPAYRNTHRSELANAAQVVAGQVHEHGVLGELLGVLQQVLLEAP